MSLRSSLQLMLVVAAVAAGQPVLAQVAPPPLTLPTMFNNPYVPTDQTPVPNWQQRIRERVLGPDRDYVPPTSGEIVARDPRYAFTGRWLPVVEAQTQVAMVPQTGSTTLLRVIPREEVATTRDTMSSGTAAGRRKRLHYIYSGIAQVMPTADAEFALTAANEVTLTRGALLVKGCRVPIHVLMPVRNDTAVVRVEEGTFAMLSNLDCRLTVANLTDTHTGGLRMMLTDRAHTTYGDMPVRIGNMLEIYPYELPCAENRLVSYSTVRQLRLENGLSVETLRLNYPFAFKRFNLTRVLSDADLHRLVKTAASVVYMDRGDVL